MLEDSSSFLSTN